ncbi:leucyl/phenylalanyl-tRNA--protein transferase [Oleisolibacter albus]|uniref:leucyl/phenylalanyl-tRNA--protein transferase n=1 Tax=Oleisolibacter albus TaxID=2171757 RepID=UPI000DF30E11|nr:leucyl/phenylalanyl-tRNA--protein transferase [Oleisolibacter albus]
MLTLTPELLLRAYAAGVFPMAESAESTELLWFDPPWRGILPLDGFHVPRRLRRTMRQTPFEVRIDSDFPAVMQACGAPAPGRESTWINAEILEAYTALHRLGHAHSVECWQSGTLVGGLYGVALGGAFFGESMFSRTSDASKVALVHLVARLRAGGYRLLDTQFVTRHLTQFGATEIPRHRYRVQLAAAVRAEATFYPALGEDDLVAALLQSTTQTS